MPITLDPGGVEVIDKNPMHTGYRRGMFDELRLTPEQKSSVVYRKLESLNSDVSDTYHQSGDLWVEQFSGMPQSLRQSGVSPRIFVSRDGGTEGAISDDDGLILTFHGTCSGLRSVDDRGNVISMEEAEELQELGGSDPQQWNLWEFRLVSLVRTDGPERRERLLDTVEDQRGRSEASLIDTISKAFSTITGNQNLNVNTMPQTPADATDAMVKQLASMNPDKREALFQMAEIESEDGEAEPLVNKKNAKATNFKKKE